MKIQDIRKIFGNNVRKYRKLQNMTQEQLAEQIYRKEETVSNIERGKTSTNVEMIYSLAKSLKVNMSDLLVDDEKDTTYIDNKRLHLSSKVADVLITKSEKYINTLIDLLEMEK